MSGGVPVPEEVVSRLGALLREGDRIVVGTGAGEPALLIEAVLAAAARRGVRLELVQVLTGSRGRITGTGPELRVVTPVPGHGAAAVEVLPSSMRQLDRAIADGVFRVDGVLLSGSRHGDALSLGISVDIAPSAFHRARFRAVELNAALPPVSVEPLLPLGSCDVVVDSHQEPPELRTPEPDERARAIAGHVAELVADGAVLELGIGRALAGVADALVDRRRRIAVHSGLLSDWTATLVDAGVASQPLDCAGTAPVVGAVAMGSAAFYGWLSERRRPLRLAGSAHAHEPAHLASLGRFVAVNASSAVDLYGQSGVRAGGTRQPALGGLLDFAVAGAYGGMSVLAVESTDVAGHSRIVPRLGAVQLPGSLVTHVVTEHGIAVLANRTWRQRARAIVAVAAPEHRAELRDTLETS